MISALLAVDNPSRLVYKPWGYEIIWAHTNSYVGKILHIKKGESLSRQYHQVKEETIRVISGHLRLEIGDPNSTNIIFFVLDMFVGDVYHISPGTIHRMVGAQDTDIVEVSTCELDDIVRLEDNYGRV